MNTDKAYLLGLVVGGGIFGNNEDIFRVRLPFNKWGSYTKNPQRAGSIARDILRTVGQMFQAVYNLTVQYETRESGTWIILCEGDTSIIKSDLTGYGIVCEGEIRKNARIDLIIADLIDENLKRRFVAGLADTIGSTAKSHRRFTEEHQILSFEIAGFNFRFVCDLCRLLYSINCIPDQINWNHPNIHCTRDPYYTQWSKGFKLRILLDQYAQFGAFAFTTKAEASNENRSLQRETHEAEICETRETKMTISSVHPAESDMRLPEIIRGGHYVNFRHFCAVLGCEHAPYEKICACFDRVGELINPFPILSRYEITKIEEIVAADPLMSEREYTTTTVAASTLLAIYHDNKEALVYSQSNIAGYPIAEILKAVAYVIADGSELNNKRTKGNYIDLIERHIQENNNISVEIRKPDLLTPLIVFGNGRGALIGAHNPVVYSRLVSRSQDNDYKLIVRPITVEDLLNAEQ